MTGGQLFDDWPERYNRWFTTPIGRLVRVTEARLIGELLNPGSGERILDAGCGTGVFTLDFLEAGASVTGLDISAGMLRYAVRDTAGYPFSAVRGDMLHLPFRDGIFDKTVSVTALEFIGDAQTAVSELFRVTRPGGTVVVATLNSLSPWAERRREKTGKGRKHVLENAHYRSPEDLLNLCPFIGVAKTAVHFRRDDEPEEAVRIEILGSETDPDSGAFAAAMWQKPLSG